ncbi:DMT family transporter [Thalassospiraceae bacterium LMO-JJ14]|nr:DMT family transporter [Thalassospiraceae bacterium LMO-JJ14]
MSDPTPATPDAGNTASNEEKKAAENLRGILWMLGSTLCLASMHTTISYVSDTVHPFVVVFCRLLFALIVVIPFFVKQGTAPLKTGRLGFLILRGVLNFCAMLAFFTALSLSPIADVTALSFTAPIFATLLAVVLLKERLGWRRIAAIVAGFVGTMIVLRPGFEEIGTGNVLVLIATIFWGACVIIIKSLSKTESSVTITTYMSLVMAPLALVPALFVWSWPSTTDLALLVLLGLFGGCGQLMVSQALKHAETHVVMPFDFVRLVWVSISGYILFGEIADIYVWSGGVLIFASTAYITIREHQKRQRISAAVSASDEVIR